MSVVLRSLYEAAMMFYEKRLGEEEEIGVNITS